MRNNGKRGLKLLHDEATRRRRKEVCVHIKQAQKKFWVFYLRSVDRDRERQRERKREGERGTRKAAYRLNYKYSYSRRPIQIVIVGNEFWRSAGNGTWLLTIRLVLGKTGKLLSTRQRYSWNWELWANTGNEWLPDDKWQLVFSSIFAQQPIYH